MLNIKNSARIKFLFLALVLLQASCSSVPELDSPETTVTGEGVLSVGSRHAGAAPVVEGDSLGGRREPQLFASTGQLLKMPKARPAIELEGNEVMLNFEKAPLEDVVHGVLGDILQLNYIIEGSIPGEVTLRTHVPIGRMELLSIVESMLQANNVALLRGENDRFVITATQAATARMPRFTGPGKSGAGFGNVIIPLRYIGATQMAEILQPVAPETAFVRVDSVRNILILAGTGEQQNAWLEIIETFDVDLLSGMSVAIFPIEHSSIDEVHKALEVLLANTSGEQGSLMGGLIRFIPLDSLGSILVVTPRESYLKQVETWIERLDREPELGAEAQLFVYSVQNGSAGHLAQLLGSVFGGSATGSRASGEQHNEGVSPGLTPSNLSSGTGQNQSRAQGTQSGANRSTGGSSFSLGDSTRVVADEVNNALLVHTTGIEYRKILSVLEKLDVVPLQVLIEATILEVTLEDNLRYGLEWYLDSSLGNSWRGSGQLDLGESGIGITAPGLGFAFNNPLGELRAVLNTLASKNLINIISTPSIMVLDNHTAAIHVGTSQPIQTSSIVIEGRVGVSSSITYRDTGVKLNVTPSVNAGGLVSMDLKQSVTDVGASVDDTTGQFPFYERNMESRIAVRSGESAILGGLISDSRRRGKSGVPFLHRLPIIGNLFGSTNISENRTELLIILTPHVIKHDQDMRDITSEMRRRMKGLRVFDEYSED